MKDLVEVKMTRSDVFVLGIGLPGMNGREALRQLRANITLQTIKVLILTVRTQSEVSAQADKVGADDFISKPFRPHGLRQHLEELLAPAA